MNAITVSIQCFGAFKKFGESLCVKVEAGSSVRQVKEALARQLGSEHEKLIEVSVLANDTSVLPGAYILKGETALSILPPVCGG